MLHAPCMPHARLHPRSHHPKPPHHTIPSTLNNPLYASPPCSYTNTSAVISRISYIDGDKGILRYRGIPIEQLAEHSSYLETAYLVVYSDLPNR